MGFCDCLRGTILALLRCALFIFNLFFVMAGGAVITIAAIIYINTEEWSEFYTRNMHRASIVCMVAGSMTVLVAAFGFYAVLKNTSRLWRTFSGMMLATFACLLAGGICTLANSTNFVEKAQANMVELMERYPAPEPSAAGNLSAKASWDRLQSEFRCCGISATSDWRPELGGLPVSCQCESGSEGCGALGDEFYFDQGCFAKLQTHSMNLVDAQGDLAISVSVLQLISVALSVGFAYCLREAPAEYEHL